MYSECDNLCSHKLDFSIRKSPDHSLLATPRGLSQLVTSFIAFLRLGIHTRALSSLTIKFTQHTHTLLRPATQHIPVQGIRLSGRPVLICALLCPSVFNCQRSCSSLRKAQKSFHSHRLESLLVSSKFKPKLGGVMVGLGRFELPTSPLSGVRSNQLSYRPSVSMQPAVSFAGGADRDRTDDLLNANQALSQLSYSPRTLVRFAHQPGE